MYRIGFYTRWQPLMLLTLVSIYFDNFWLIQFPLNVVCIMAMFGNARLMSESIAGRKKATEGIEAHYEERIDAAYERTRISHTTIGVMSDIIEHNDPPEDQHYLRVSCHNELRIEATKWDWKKNLKLKLF